MRLINKHMNISCRFFYIFFFIALLNPLILVSAEEPSLEELTVLEAIREKQKEAEEAEEDEYKEIKTYLMDREECEDCIYGFNLFRSTPTTFSLASNVPVPPSYTLGPGDKIRIEYYGNENLTKEGFITRTGTLHLPLLGPVTLAGLTFSEAEAFIT